MAMLSSVEPVSPTTMRSTNGAALARHRARTSAPFFTIIESSTVGFKGRRFLTRGIETGAEKELSASAGLDSSAAFGGKDFRFDVCDRFRNRGIAIVEPGEGFRICSLMRNRSEMAA